MIFFVIALLNLLAATAAVPLDWRIIGGGPAADGQFPYQISLRMNDIHQCGGTILTKRCALTAAHCVHRQDLNTFTLVTGSNKLNEGGTTYKVSKIVIYDGYDFLDLLNDLAIVCTETPIIFNDKVQPLELGTEEIGGGEPMTLSGWGSTILGGGTINELQYIQLTSLDLEECKTILDPFVVSDEMLCTYTRQGEGACHGDSGGPLTHDGKLVGVVSWGRPCAKGYPDVFTRVSSFYDWIKKQTKDED